MRLITLVALLLVADQNHPFDPPHALKNILQIPERLLQGMQVSEALAFWARDLQIDVIGLWWLGVLGGASSLDDLRRMGVSWGMSLSHNMIDGKIDKLWTDAIAQFTEAGPGANLYAIAPQLNHARRALIQGYINDGIKALFSPELTPAEAASIKLRADIDHASRIDANDRDKNKKGELSDDELRSRQNALESSWSELTARSMPVVDYLRKIVKAVVKSKYPYFEFGEVEIAARIGYTNKSPRDFEELIRAWIGFFTCLIVAKVMVQADADPWLAKLREFHERVHMQYEVRIIYEMSKIAWQHIVVEANFKIPQTLSTLIASTLGKPDLWSPLHIMIADMSKTPSTPKDKIKPDDDPFTQGRGRGNPRFPGRGGNRGGDRNETSFRGRGGRGGGRGGRGGGRGGGGNTTGLGYECFVCGKGVNEHQRQGDKVLWCQRGQSSQGDRKQTGTGGGGDQPSDFLTDPAAIKRKLDAIDPARVEGQTKAVRREISREEKIPWKFFQGRFAQGPRLKNGEKP